MRTLAVLGSTGSIGTATLSVVESFPEHFRIAALAAGRNLDLLRQQIVSHQPQTVAVERREDAEQLATEFPHSSFAWGVEGLQEASCHPRADMVVVALVGSSGLQPTIAAVDAGKDIVLANKETLVVAGELVIRHAARRGVSLLPVDSEHNAIHQALRVGPADSVHRLILTASGGPFREWPARRLAEATVDDALAHPTWRMGPKISVDSATMMNKGLEIIEAHHLFGVPEERIEIVIHPQSLVHSLVEYVDGTLIAQLSVNDMRFPIMYALAWPERLPTPLPRLDLAEIGRFDFEALDDQRFPAPNLAREALRSGGELPAVLNAANEAAVQAFLDCRIPFPAIVETVATVVDRWSVHNRALSSFEQAIAADREARLLTAEVLQKYGKPGHGSE